MSGKDPEATNPGLTQAEDGTPCIGPAASRHSREKAEKEALENAEKVVESINVETEKEGNEGYIEGDESSPGTLPSKAEA